MSQFTHEGVEITLHEDSGKFTATISGRMVRKSSLSAIKKAIDNSKAEAFVPFTVLYRTDNGEKAKGLKLWRRVTITSKRPRGRGYRNPAVYLDGDGREIGGGWYSTVLKDCPEVIKLLKLDEKNDADAKAAEKRYEKIRRDLDNKIEKFAVKPE